MIYADVESFCSTLHSKYPLVLNFCTPVYMNIYVRVCLFVHIHIEYWIQVNEITSTK